MAGIKLATFFYDKDMVLIPELHTMVNYDVKNKFPNIDAKLDGINGTLSTKSFKPAKVFLNIGSGITAKYYNNILECGIRYNSFIAEKYLAH